jgi:hypothetical protein
MNTGAGNPIPTPKLRNKFGSAFDVIGTRKANTRME